MEVIIDEKTLKDIIRDNYLDMFDDESLDDIEFRSNIESKIEAVLHFTERVEKEEIEMGKSLYTLSINETEEIIDALDEINERIQAWINAYDPVNLYMISIDELQDLNNRIKGIVLDIKGETGIE